MAESFLADQMIRASTVTHDIHMHIQEELQEKASHTDVPEPVPPPNKPDLQPATPTRQKLSRVKKPSKTRMLLHIID